MFWDLDLIEGIKTDPAPCHRLRHGEFWDLDLIEGIKTASLSEYGTTNPLCFEI